MEKTGALLYKKTDRWQIWICLLATILLFACAVALVRGESAAAIPLGSDENVPFVIIDPNPAPPPATPEATPEVSPPTDLDNAAISGFRRWRFKPGRSRKLMLQLRSP